MEKIHQKIEKMPSFFSFFFFSFWNLFILFFGVFFFFVFFPSSFLFKYFFLKIVSSHLIYSGAKKKEEKKKKKKSTTYNWYRLGDHASSMDKTSCVPGSRQRHQRMKLRGVCQMFIIVGPLPEGLQYWADPWRGLSKPSAPRLRPKISLIS